MSYIKVKIIIIWLEIQNQTCIINTNKLEYDEYIARRKQKQNEKQKVDNLERDVSTLRNEITEIKDMLRSLVNGN